VAGLAAAATMSTCLRAQAFREWRCTHEVTVIDGGYEHQGKRWPELKVGGRPRDHRHAVVRALFFGLRKTGNGG
jgi:hypothetical protein